MHSTQACAKLTHADEVAFKPKRCKEFSIILIAQEYIFQFIGELNGVKGWLLNNCMDRMKIEKNTRKNGIEKENQITTLR